MKLTVERLPESRVSLDIAADENEFAQAMNRAARRVANEVAIPGFRKGKAPRAMIERLYGREVFIEEANRTLMTDLYRQAMTEVDLVPIGDPEVEIIEIEPLAFKVITAVFPQVEPGPYQDVRIESLDASIDESEVDTVIEQLRKNNSPWVDPESEGLEVGADLLLEKKQRLPREGDQVTFDVTSQADDDEAAQSEEDAVFILGESGLLDELEDAIKQLHVGDTTTVDVAFAEDEERANAEVRGKRMTYTITLKGIKERDLLPLDDELARTVSDDFDTLEELRANVRDNLHRDKTTRLESEAYGQILDKMLEQATIELPTALVDDGVDREVEDLQRRLVSGGLSLEAYLRSAEQTEDELREELRPAISRRLRMTLLLQEVAKREEISVPDEEIEEGVKYLSSVLASQNVSRASAAQREDSFRESLRSQMEENRLRRRLIEIATEGTGAVVHGWVPPEPSETEAEEAEVETSAEADPPAAIEEALTIGTMPGQPGDLAETPIAAEPGVGVETEPVPTPQTEAETDESTAEPSPP